MRQSNLEHTVVKDISRLITTDCLQAPAVASLEELAEEAPSVFLTTRMGRVLDMMEQNHIREIAVLDADQKLIGTLEARHILSHYLHAKTEAGF